MDRLDFQHEFEGLFRQWTGRAFDDCLVQLGDGARKSIEACMMEFYFSQSPVNDMLREFTVQSNQNLSYPQLTYLLALGHTKASIYEVADSAPGAGILLQDLIRGDEPVRIPVCSASEVLTERDKLLTRVVKSRTGIQISGGTLVIPKQLWPHLSAKIDGQLTERGPQASDLRAFREELAEEMTWYTLSCWVNAFSGPGAPPPRLVDFDRD
jgi:hypothetical protein